MKIRIIPCLDVDRGRVVKGINFVDLVDAGDPVEQAKIYSKSGADEITFLDITATHEKRNPMVDIIEKTAYECFVPLTVGGGVRELSDMDKFLSGLINAKAAPGKDRVIYPGLPEYEEQKIRKAEISCAIKIKDGVIEYNKCLARLLDVNIEGNWFIFIFIYSSNLYSVLNSLFQKFSLIF